MAWACWSQEKDPAVLLLEVDLFAGAHANKLASSHYCPVVEKWALDTSNIRLY